MARKFFKTIVQIEILSEDEPYPDGKSLQDINYDITDGHCSGVVKTIKSEQLTGADAAEALLSQGSDPYFFQLDNEGNEIG